MGPSREERRERYVAKATAELEGLARRGVVMCGNAFSQVLLLKGEPGDGEQGADGLLSGADGDALRAALQALGYAPEDWVGLAAWDDSGQPLDCALLRESLAALDPATVVVCDEAGADLVRETYADELASLESFEEAMLAEGAVALVLGMRVMGLGGFAASLADDDRKQLMWRRLKQLPPLGEPY